MVKKSKLSTPEWVLEGYASEAEYNKSKGIKKTKKAGRIFKIRECPECKSDDVSVIVGMNKKGDWQCNKCKWTGKNIFEQELSEEEFMKYFDERGDK